MVQRREDGLDAALTLLDKTVIGGFVPPVFNHGAGMDNGCAVAPERNGDALVGH